MTNTAVTHEYGAEQITVLEGLEAVRKRPGMYIGPTDINGLHHMIRELVDNSVDEALAGYADTIDVRIHADNKVSAGLHGVGLSVVNALSDWMFIEVRQNGKLYRQDYRHGVPNGQVKPIRDAEGTGTFQRFMP